MQKFYKYFTTIVLSIFVFWLFSVLLFGGAESKILAQAERDERCANQNVFVLEESNSRTVHIVYDFYRSTVSIVQIQKGYNPPDLNVKTKPLGQ